MEFFHIEYGLILGFVPDLSLIKLYVNTVIC